MRMLTLDDHLFSEIAETNDIAFNEEERAPHGILREQCNRGEVFVIERVGRVVSFAIVTERFLSPYIWSIATDPNFRGQGYAGQLLDEIEAWARQENKVFIFLTTHENNPAQKLYFDKGYRVLKVVGDYYLSGNGLLMRRKLL